MEFSWGNFKTDIDNTDIEIVKAYERNLEDFYRRVSKINMHDKASGIYSEIYSAGQAMLDGFFGDGTTKDMFGESQSVRKIMMAICGLNTFMNDVSGIVESMKEIGT